jgi:hypothetical protein
MNLNAQAAAAAKRDEPIRVASLKAQEIVEALLRPEGDYEAARGPRRIQVTNFVVHATSPCGTSPGRWNPRPGTYAPPKMVKMDCGPSALGSEPTDVVLKTSRH